MRKFHTFTGLVAPLDAADVDTDQIIPKQFLKAVTRSGFGRYLFANWRYRPDGGPEPDFVLNQPRYQGATVLLTRRNFGCGSSREHAVWALVDYGFRAVVAPSFADIFKGNAFNNGLLCVELEEQMVEEWFRRVQAQKGYRITVDLDAQTLTGSDGFACSFGIDPQRRQDLLEGRDAIARTERLADEIAAYEAAHAAPWQAGAPSPTPEVEP